MLGARAGRLPQRLLRLAQPRPVGARAGRRGAAGAHPPARTGEPPDVRRPAHPGRPAGGRCALRPQAGGAADAAGRAGGLSPAALSWAPRSGTGGPARHPTACSASSWPARPTSSGRLTSPPSPPWRASSTWRSCSTCAAGGSWAGPWPTICAPSWSWLPWRWPSGTAGRPRGVIHHSDHGSQYTVGGLRRALPAGGHCPLVGLAWATATTTRSPRASSPRWNASCSTGSTSAPWAAADWRSSTSSRASTTRAAGTPLSATRARLPTNGGPSACAAA